FSCAASLFYQVRLVGVVGSDFPQEHLDMLGARGIDTSGIEVAHGRTFRWHGRYHTDMNARDTVDVQLNVFGEFQPKIPPAYRDSEYVFLANCRPALQKQVLDQIRGPQARPGGPKLVMADTMNMWIENNRDELEEVLSSVDGLLVNDDEARLLTGAANAVAAGRSILDMGPDMVVIKKGEHGALLFAEGECLPLPAYPTEQVIDPTGAGDSFAGALMGSLAAHLAEEGDASLRALKRAVAYGTVAASFTV
ncbi:unnamed protein product, partial [marine sediment metagenome]